MKRHLHPNLGHSPFWTCLAACGALASVACEGNDPRDLGSSSAPITLNAPFQSDVDEFAGRWVGSAEDTLGVNGNGATYAFPSGSTQIVLDVAIDDTGANGPLQGSIRFGSGAPLPPATDPDAGYPVGVSYDALLAYDELGVAFLGDRSLPPFEGVDYPVGSSGQLTGDEDGATTAADGVINFTFSANQPLDAWCQLQTPFAHDGDPDFHLCIPDTGGQLELTSPGTDATCTLSGPFDTSNCTEGSELSECIEGGEPVASLNCDKVFLCSSTDYCTCTEDGCTATPTNSRLTVRRVGDELVGVFQNTVFVNGRNLRVPLGEVRLSRVLDD